MKRSQAYRDRRSARLKWRRRHDPEFAERQREKSRKPKSERQRLLHRASSARYENKPGRKESRKKYWKDYYTVEKRSMASRSRRKHRQKPEVKLQRLEYQRRYRASLKGKAITNSLASKRRLRASAQSLPDVQVAYNRLLSVKQPKCFYCGSKIARERRHIDHVKPLCDNGAHGAYNLVISCAPCNQRKNGKPVNAFVIGQLLLVF